MEQQCPVDRALSRCPFLHNLCEKEGRAYAASFALNPLAPAGSSSRELRRRPILEEEQDLAATFRLFHGRDTGVFPLASLKGTSGCVVPAPASAPTSATLSGLNTASAARCPFSAVAEPPTAPLLSLAQPTSSRAPPMGSNPLAGAPLATLSLGMPDFGEFLRRLQQGQPKPKPKPKPSTRRPPSNRPDIKPSATGSTSISQPPNISPAPPPGPAPAPGPAAAGGAQAGALCPLRKWLGPYAGIVFNKAGNLHCPEPIVRARAALAQTQTVRALRPQTLPIKLIAVGAIAAAANVPCGMWREHTDKFSAQWFLAVHATIPFIAMLRKAVIMPKLAIVCTIAAAIAGQAIGARLERERMRQAAALVMDAEDNGLDGGQSRVARLQQPGVEVTVAAAATVPASKRVKAFRTRPAARVVVSTTGSGSSSSNAVAAVPATTALGRLMEGDAAEWRMEAGRKGAKRAAAARQLLALPAAVAAH